MSAYKITIFWKEFEPVISPVISNETYINHKTSKSSFYHIEFNYVQTFYVELIIICVGVFLLFIDSNAKDVMYVLEMLIALAAIFSFISVIISSFYYIDAYQQSKVYTNKLNEALFSSNSYKDFCVIMSGFDNRYSLQLNRMENNKI